MLRGSDRRRGRGLVASWRDEQGVDQTARCSSARSRTRRSSEMVESPSSGALALGADGRSFIFAQVGAQVVDHREQALALRLRARP